MLRAIGVDMSHRVTESVRVHVNNKTSLRGYATATKVKPRFHQNANPFCAWRLCFVLF